MHVELIIRSGYRAPIAVIETLGGGLLKSKRQNFTVEFQAVSIKRFLLKNKK